jgi:transcriptional regulator with XRE-family HTH domain
MSPFSHFLYAIRLSRQVRQSELAIKLGYEQSYISSLEVGLKGPPTEEFIERLIQTLKLTFSEQYDLRDAVRASQRKLVIDQDSPQDIYWLLDALRNELCYLKPNQVSMIREILRLRETMAEERPEPQRRLRRRRKKLEVLM